MKEKVSENKMLYTMNALDGYPTVDMIEKINNKDAYYYMLHANPYNVYIPHMIARNRIHAIIHALLATGVIKPDDIISTLDESAVINPVSNRYNYNGVNISIISTMNDVKTCISIKYNIHDGYNVSIWNTRKAAHTVSKYEIHAKRMSDLIAGIC